jgi:hypothetical protein
MNKFSSFIENTIIFVFVPGQVTEKVLVTACVLVDGELIDDTNTRTLRWAAGKLKDVSAINTDDWGNEKIVKALKIIFEPVLTTVAETEVVLIL